MAEKTDSKASKKKKDGSQRINIDVAPGVLRILDSYLERQNTAPDRTRPTITYTDVINQALEEFFPDSATKK